MTLLCGLCCCCGRYRGALRRQRENVPTEATGVVPEAASRLHCEFEENVVYDVHVQDGHIRAHLHDIRLGKANDCCLACIAEPLCNSWSMLVGLRYCQLSKAEVGPPGTDGQPLGRKQSEDVVSGRLVGA